MKNLILFLLMLSVSLGAYAQKGTTTGGNGSTASLIVNIDSLITPPSGCVDGAELIAHEINILNADSSIAAFAYVDLSTAFTYSSNEAILIATIGGTFEIVDSTYTFYRTRVAQSCKIDCCRKVVRWSDWIYNGSVLTPQIEAVNDTIQISEVGIVSPVDVTLNDTSSDCEPITYTVSNEVNVTVVNNNDGTFDATPIAAGTWSFDYTATCSDGITSGTAIVSGDAVGIPIIIAVNDTIQISEAGIVSSVDVTLNDTSSGCEPITYTVLNEVNVIVVNNNDGTFDATPIAAGTWSFDYTATCSDGLTSGTAIVSGDASGSSFPKAGSACTATIATASSRYLNCAAASTGYIAGFSPEVYVADGVGGCNPSTANEIFVNENYQFNFNANNSGFTSTVNWGDGATEVYNQVMYHTYSSVGTYTITVTLDCDGSMIGTITLTVI